MMTGEKEVAFCSFCSLLLAHRNRNSASVTDLTNGTHHPTSGLRRSYLIAITYLAY